MNPVAIVVIIAAVIGGLAYYRYDVKRRPRRPCRWPGCQGSGISSSRIGRGLSRPFGSCWCCGGRKSHPRPALRFVDADAYRQLRGEVRQARQRVRART